MLQRNFERHLLSPASISPISDLTDLRRRSPISPISAVSNTKDHIPIVVVFTHVSDLKKWLNRREGSILEISGADPIIVKGSWHHSPSLMAPPLGFAMRRRRRRRRNVGISPAVLSSLIRDVNGFLGLLRTKGLNSSGDGNVNPHMTVRRSQCGSWIILWRLISG